jgi:hypothetical protein
MRRFLLIFLFAACSVCAQQPSVPEIPFRSVPDFLQLPADLYFGEVAGVAVNSKGHIFVFSRGNTTGAAYAAAAAQLLEFGPDGKFLREIGHNLYAWSYAHTVKIDPQDNIWVTDKGSDVVVKFNPQGRISMVFGRKQEASDDGTGPLKEVNPPLPAEDGLFRQVTDVAWDSAANTYISDGYINSRVAKIDKDGNWLKSWVNLVTSRVSSILRTASPSTHRTMFTLRTAEIIAFKSSMEMASFSARSSLMSPSTRLPAPRLATKQNIHQDRERQGLRGQSASRRHPIRFSTVQMLSRDGSIS